MVCLYIEQVVNHCNKGSVLPRMKNTDNACMLVASKSGRPSWQVFELKDIACPIYRRVAKCLQ